MRILLEKRYWLLPVIFFIVLFFSSGLFKAMDVKPIGVHQWRQTDCASFALNYYQNNTPFLKPQMHNQTGSNGYAASEFPIIYFITGKLYAVFGFHEWVFRSVNLLFFFVGLWYLFLIVRRFTGNVITAMVPVIIAGTSPMYFYYGAHFLPNVPAISLCFAGWYYFFHFLERRHPKWIYLCAIFFCLAGLLKVSDLLSFFAAGFFLVISIFHNKQLFSKKTIAHIAISGTTALAIIYAWVKYTIWFNAKNGVGYFMLGILPVWNLDGKQIADIRSRFYTAWSLHIFSPVVWIILGLVLMLFIIRFRFMHQQLRLLTVFLFIGSIAYLLLFFEALYHHDYYMLTPMVAIIFLLITVVHYIFNLLQKYNSVIRSAIAVSLLLALTTWCLVYNSKKQHHRLYSPQYANVSDATYELEPYLRSLGIDRTDLVVSVPDKSPNISLYLFNNPGWTEVYTLHEFTIDEGFKKGAQYLIIGDSSYLQKENYKPFLQYQIGAYKNFLIYDLQQIIR